MKNQVIIIFTIIASIVVVSLLLSSKPKIAYVVSDTLVNEYAGMKEAKQAFRIKQQQWMANLDTLRSDLQQAIQRDLPQAQLQSLQQNFDRYNLEVQQLAQEEDSKMTKAVLDQINNFIELYGEREGYDFIMGTTSDGSLLYGKAKHDITQELQVALNEYYMTGEYD